MSEYLLGASIGIGIYIVFRITMRKISNRLALIEPPTPEERIKRIEES